MVGTNDFNDGGDNHQHHNTSAIRGDAINGNNVEPIVPYINAFTPEQQVLITWMMTDVISKVVALAVTGVFQAFQGAPARAPEERLIRRPVEGILITQLKSASHDRAPSSRVRNEHIIGHHC